MGTREDNLSREWKDRPKRKGVGGRKNRRHELKRDGERNISSEADGSIPSRKALLFHVYPYRKPTQVDEERILRPTGEVLLRNSAKWSRNLGRRDAR